MKRLKHKAAEALKNMAQSQVMRLLMATNLLVYSGHVAAQSMGGGIQLPMGKFFCDVAGAMQSQWAPGIILIVIIVEAFLFLVVKKGVLQMLMVVLLAATLALSAGKFLKIISPNHSCQAID